MEFSIEIRAYFCFVETNKPFEIFLKRLERDWRTKVYICIYIDWLNLVGKISRIEYCESRFVIGRKRRRRKKDEEK